MQRAKGHANQSGVRNGTETNELENVNNWTHQVRAQQNYNAAANASMAVAAGAYPLSNYYGPASYHYPATYCVGGEGTAPNAWPNNDPAITYVGNYNGQLTTTDAAAAAAAYAMDGMYGPAAYGNPYAAAAGAPAGAPHDSSFNYFTTAAGNVASSPAEYAPAAPWGAATSAVKHYENYYRDATSIDGVPVYNGVDSAIAMKNIDHNLRNLDLGSGSAAADPNSNQKRYARSYGDVLNRTDAFLNAAALSATASSTANAAAASEKKTTWASIAKQPAKPVPQTSSSSSKKKGPGMPPPPMVPGRHNIDLNTWEVKNNPPKAPVAQAPPPPVTPSVSALAKPVWNGPELRPPSQMLPNSFDPNDAGPRSSYHYDEPTNSSKSQPTISVSSTHAPAPPVSHQKPLSGVPPSATVPHSTNRPPHDSPPSSTSSPPIIPPSSLPSSHHRSSTATSATSSCSSSSHLSSAVTSQNSSGYGSNNNNNNNNNNIYSNRTRKTRNDSTSSGGNNNNNNNFSSNGNDKNMMKNSPNNISHNNNNNDNSGYDMNRLSSSSSDSTAPPHSVVDKLKDKNNYNPVELELPPRGTRFFVIKSYAEDDIHRSIKYEIWCSTEHGNKRLDEAYNDQKSVGGAVYLFFSVNGSGHFCGMAQMISPVDYGASSSVWAQDKWKGQFKVRWIYVKDVPNSHLRHIKLENNENKPVTNSRDTQEVPYEKGVNVLKIIHAYMHTTSIFDDFTHYEKRQEEGDNGKRGGGGGGGGGPPPSSSYHQGSSAFSSQSYQPYRNSAFGGKNFSNRDRNGGSNFTMNSYNRRGGGRNNYGNSCNMDSNNSRSNRIEF